MRIGLFGEGIENDLLTRDIFSKLSFEEEFDAQMMNQCLCNITKIDDLNVLIIHPHYDNKSECWTRIKQVIEYNPSKLFYLFAINASERKDFFGRYEKKPKNLTYLDKQEGRAFCEDPVKFLKNNSQ